MIKPVPRCFGSQNDETVKVDEIDIGSQIKKHYNSKKSQYSILKLI